MASTPQASCYWITRSGDIQFATFLTLPKKGKGERGKGKGEIVNEERLYFLITSSQSETGNSIVEALPRLRLLEAEPTHEVAHSQAGARERELTSPQPPAPKVNEERLYFLTRKPQPQVRVIRRV